MVSRRVRQLMIGLPQTGKTTFLAALWYVLRAGEISASLSLGPVRGDREYLNRIADQWGRCEALERTAQNNEVTISIEVIDPSTGVSAELSIPDMSGESFEGQWEARECHEDYVELAQGADGVLVFVHPDCLRETDSIAEANEVLAVWTDDPGEHSLEQNVEEPVKPWDGRFTPTQVVMVELMQFLQGLRGGPVRIALIVSAWDLVAEDTTPDTWLSRRLPLLHQYFEANEDTIEWRAYGVSAQGGRLEDDAVLLAIDDASRRVRILGQEAAGHDITVPVRWLMSISGF